ncbi:MAG TPA: hypothetical protein DD390_12050, partial [Rhodospirillaceae bacterium]|nr:hypothetical protein [Rhodospirillaceae bacterium]
IGATATAAAFAAGGQLFADDADRLRALAAESADALGPVADVTRDAGLLYGYVQNLSNMPDPIPTLRETLRLEELGQHIPSAAAYLKTDVLPQMTAFAPTSEGFVDADVARSIANTAADTVPDALMTAPEIREALWQIAHSADPAATLTDIIQQNDLAPATLGLRDSLTPEILEQIYHPQASLANQAVDFVATHAVDASARAGAFLEGIGVDPQHLADTLQSWTSQLNFAVDESEKTGPVHETARAEAKSSHQALFHELAPNLNPAGVEAYMRLLYNDDLDDLPRETFVQEIKVAALHEHEEPGFLAKIAEDGDLKEDFEAWEKTLTTVEQKDEMTTAFKARGMDIRDTGGDGTALGCDLEGDDNTRVLITDAEGAHHPDGNTRQFLVGLHNDTDLVEGIFRNVDVTELSDAGLIADKVLHDTRAFIQETLGDRKFAGSDLSHEAMLAAFAAGGFEIRRTAGGNDAFVRDLDPDHEIRIVIANDLTHPIDATRVFDVGIVSNDGTVAESFRLDVSQMEETDKAAQAVLVKVDHLMENFNPEIELRHKQLLERRHNHEYPDRGTFLVYSDPAKGEEDTINGVLHIEVAKERAEHGSETTVYNLTIGNMTESSEDLAVLEAKLAQWAFDEGYETLPVDMNTPWPDGIQPRDIRDAVFKDTLDAACAHLQDKAGITDGGIAAYTLSDIEDGWSEMDPESRSVRIEDWLAYEKKTSLDFASEQTFAIDPTRADQNGTEESLSVFDQTLDAAQQNDVAAMRDVAFLYENGMGTEQDAKAAAQWTIRANREEARQKILKEMLNRAELGDPSAQFDLAVLYHTGRDVLFEAEQAGRFIPQDSAMAVKWLDLAAQQGHVDATLYRNFVDSPDRIHRAARLEKPEAQYTLGLALRSNPDKDQNAEDTRAALTWFGKAADQGFAPAQYQLGLCHDLGKVGWDDPVTAARLYTLAAEQGHENAQHRLGGLYSDGFGVEVDADEAAKWRDKAAAQQDRRQAAWHNNPDMQAAAHEAAAELKQRLSFAVSEPETDNALSDFVEKAVAATPADQAIASEWRMSGDAAQLVIGVNDNNPITALEIRHRTALTRPDPIFVVSGATDPFNEERLIPISAHNDLAGAVVAAHDLLAQEAGGDATGRRGIDLAVLDGTSTLPSARDALDDGEKSASGQSPNATREDPKQGPDDLATLKQKALDELLALEASSLLSMDQVKARRDAINSLKELPADKLDQINGNTASGSLLVLAEPDDPAKKRALRSILNDMPDTRYDRGRDRYVIDSKSPGAQQLQERLGTEQPLAGTALAVPKREEDLVATLGGERDPARGQWLVPKTHPVPSLFEAWQGKSAELAVANEADVTKSSQVRAFIERRQPGNQADQKGASQGLPNTAEAVLKMAADLDKTLAKTRKKGAEVVLDADAPLQDRVLAGIAGREAIIARRQRDDLQRHARAQGLHFDKLANKGMTQTIEANQAKTPKKARKRSAGLEM